jgi:GntR family transcriptional regulator/MocR family aminotransferase
VLAPALRIGYLLAPPPLAERFTALRSITDGQGDPITEVAVADLIEDGELQRHVRRVRGVYCARRDAIAAALRVELGDALRFEVPPAAWRSGPAPAARRRRRVGKPRSRRGVIVSTGREFAMDGRPRPFFRLGFAQRTEPEIAEAGAPSGVRPPAMS